LVALLEANGIPWRHTHAPIAPTAPKPSRLSTPEKLALFGRLFRGRPDVYPVRWESKASDKSGYTPACANEWRKGLCEKPRIKCSECGNRELIPMADAVLFKHLAGDHTIGAYPLLPDDTCHFLAVDFDEADWRDDAQAFVLSCRELGAPVALEISRSGNGAHAWIFFADRVAARDARRLGSAIISQQPIIFMQCGPTRHTVARPESAPKDLEVVPRIWPQVIDASADIGIQEVFRRLATDGARTAAIADEVQAAFNAGRKVLVLTERTEHLAAIEIALEGRIPPPFVLHGRMSAKQRSALATALDQLPPEAPRVLLSTGKLVGEGFDHPALDTLVLAMPISWKGTLQQYAGRLHRDHVSKADVRIVDFVDTGHPALLRMWDKRQNGYRAMGYRISDAGERGGSAAQLALAA